MLCCVPLYCLAHSNVLYCNELLVGSPAGWLDFIRIRIGFLNDSFRNRNQPASQPADRPASHPAGQEDRGVGGLVCIFIFLILLIC